MSNRIYPLSSLKTFEDDHLTSEDFRKKYQDIFMQLYNISINFYIGYISALINNIPKEEHKFGNQMLLEDIISRRNSNDENSCRNIQSEIEYLDMLSEFNQYLHKYINKESIISFSSQESVKYRKNKFLQKTITLFLRIERILSIPENKLKQSNQEKLQNIGKIIKDLIVQIGNIKEENIEEFYQLEQKYIDNLEKTDSKITQIEENIHKK